MATLQEIITTVPALLDDASTSVFTADFILPYVNTAQRKIASRLRSNNVRSVRFRQDSAMIVPAGTTRIGRWNEATQQAPPNLVAFSKDFAVAATKWQVGSGLDTPAVVAAQTDPEGGSTAGKWTFAAASAHEMYTESPVAADAGTSTFVTGSVWLRTSGGIPYTATVFVGTSTAAGSTFRVNVTSAWQRVVVTHGPVTTAGTEKATLKITYPVLAGLVSEVAFPTLTYTQEFLGYTATAGLPVSATYPPTFPKNLIVPDELWEAEIGKGNDSFYRVIGPTPIPNTAQAVSLGYWDWYNQGEIRLLGSTVARQLRIDYWGDLENFTSPANASQAVLIDGAVNAISFLCCYHIATSRGQHELAQGFYANAENEINDIINVELKMQQQQPVRRQPYRGQGRYDGYFRGYR